MAHIHDQPGQHDLTVSAYIVRTDFDQPKIMLHKHKKLNKYLQFGGHVELDENPWQALTHELREESGYNLDQLELLQPRIRLKRATGSLLHPQPVCINTHKITDEHAHIDVNYLFVTNQEPAGEIDPHESTDIQLFGRDELQALPEDEVFANVKDIGLFIFDDCLSQWERVPAAGV